MSEVPVKMMDQTPAPAPPRRTRMKWVVLAAALLALAIGAALWFWFAGPNTGKYGPMLAQLAAGQLGADDKGRVTLAEAFPGLTPRDEAFVLRRDDGSFAAFIPTYYPKGIAIVGLLY